MVHLSGSSWYHPLVCVMFLVATHGCGIQWSVGSFGRKCIQSCSVCRPFWTHPFTLHCVPLHWFLTHYTVNTRTTLIHLLYTHSPLYIFPVSLLVAVLITLAPERHGYLQNRAVKSCLYCILYVPTVSLGKARLSNTYPNFLMHFAF